jgi:hypothetical protein
MTTTFNMTLNNIWQKKWQKVKSVNILVYYKYSLYLCNKLNTHG